MRTATTIGVIIALPFAILAAILLLPVRLYDSLLERDTNWSDSPYSFLAEVFEALAHPNTTGEEDDK